ncbi:coproporphyrinogen III oxidase [Clostridium sp. MSJ-4]|uniref:Coproporphyrinogen III oxidase n=1 Tax=Clostridium simiarum TaxID=2841506 RepID=A0ABS6EXL8_9CLOT|nr:coproporphyrinogen III oxidase [Clostridium simiarum]MBU5590967.1 coproporphyrinogen III oxidase [Clostridium simiarum]
MGINIKLNDMSYRYEVYQIINLFHSLEDIDFVESDENFYVHIDKDYMEIGNKDYSKEFQFSKGVPIKEEIKKYIYSYFSKLYGIELPWGTLIGIRPSKIALALLKDGYSEKEIIERFQHRNLTKKDKVELCIEIAKYEEKFINVDKNKVSIYVGMPFCPTRCLYCSFTSNPIAGNKRLVEPYLNALVREIKEVSSFIKSKSIEIDTVYFGGGTPTAVDDDNFEYVMKNIYENLVLDFKVREFTVECGRPDSITETKLKSMKRYAVDRISINPQSMNDDTLKLIGRMHSAKDVIDKFNLARRLGFNNINMDIIVGLPGEKVSHMNTTLDMIKSLAPESITVHGLSIKRASRLYEDLKLNKIYEIADQKELIKMYEATKDTAKELGMIPYYMYRQKNMVGNMENVGYSIPGMECIYNIQMIEEKQTIIAFGADAVSKVVFLDENRIERFPNVKDIREYVNRIDEMIEKKKDLLNTLYNL